MKILHIDTSINGTNSASRRISAEAVRAMAARHDDVEIIHRDLAEAPLPHLTLAEFGTEESQQALAEFQTADVVVIGAGMYNFTVPSQLKSWLDRIIVSGKTFRYTETGPEGLAGGKRVIIALARGGFYAQGTPAAGLEHAETYLRGAFAFMGISDIQILNADGTSIPEMRDAAIRHAEQKAAAVAA